MITKNDVYTLASLARIELSDTEAESLTHELDSILGYIGQVTETTGSLEREVPKLRNIMREDVVTHKPREYTEKLFSNVPSREGSYLKVKKIL